MNINDIYDLVIEFGAVRGVPYIMINDNNVLEILQNAEVISFVHSIRDLAGLYLVFSTLISVLNNIHELFNGKFKLGGSDYEIY